MAATLLAVFALFCWGLSPIWRGTASIAALRSTSCRCYNRAMGTQGLSINAPIHRWAAAKSRRFRFGVVMSSLILPGLAGCSSNSSWSPSSWSSNPPANQAAAVGPPPNAAVASAAQPAYARQATAPPAPRQYSASAQPAPTPASVPSTAAAPSSYQSAAVTPAVSTEDARNRVYPSVSLIDLFKEGTPGFESTANMPHPPSTYTPSDQPYSPTAGQTAATATTAPASTDHLPGVPYPSESMVDLFKRQAQESQ